MTTAKHGIISTERETVEGGIMKDSTNKQRRALGGSKEERFRTVIDDIEEAVKISNEQYISQQKHLGYFNHHLGCPSCISVTEECYQIHCRFS